MSGAKDTSPAVMVLDSAAQVAERLLSIGKHAFDRAELHVHAWRVGRDPSTHRWLEDVQRTRSDRTWNQDEIDPDLLRKYIAEDQASS